MPTANERRKQLRRELTFWQRVRCWWNGHDFPHRDYRDRGGMKDGHYDYCWTCGAWR